MNHMKTTNYSKLAILIYEGKLTLEEVYRASFQLGVNVEREYVKLLSAAATAEVNKLAIVYAVKCGVEAVDRLVPLTNLMGQIDYWEKKDKAGESNSLEQFYYFQSDINKTMQEAVTINTENLQQLRNIRYNLGITDSRIIALGKFSKWVGENLDIYSSLLKEHEQYINRWEDDIDPMANRLNDDLIYFNREFDCLVEQINFLTDFSKYYNEAAPRKEYQSLLKQYEQYRKFKGGK